MKTILIAYDASECADAIFTELQHAGLPKQLRAQVVAVVEAWTLPASDPANWVPVSEAFPILPQPPRGAVDAEHGAAALAGRGAGRLRALFPDWQVEAVGKTGSPARAIIEQARDVSADLIFIGSHSRSVVGRFFLGSVSQKVAAEAKCTVRICRPRPRSGAVPRLLVAVDGSPPSQASVQAVVERRWPAGTVVAAVLVFEPWLREPAENSREWLRSRDATLNWLEAVATAAHRQIEIPGLVPERHTLDGEPKHTLIEWAEKWNADCIFVGASGLQHPGTETLGTVASALAVRAHCSVEIVRR